MAEGHREDENGREQRREKEKREGKELAQERAAAAVSGVDAIFVLRLQHGESRFSLLFWRLTRLDPEHR